jgi:hypothetical protein
MNSESFLKRRFPREEGPFDHYGVNMLYRVHVWHLSSYVHERRSKCDVLRVFTVIFFFKFLSFYRRQLREKVQRILIFGFRAAVELQFLRGTNRPVHRYIRAPCVPQVYIFVVAGVCKRNDNKMMMMIY